MELILNNTPIFQLGREVRALSDEVAVEVLANIKAGIYTPTQVLAGRKFIRDILEARK